MPDSYRIDQLLKLGFALQTPQTRRIRTRDVDDQVVGIVGKFVQTDHVVDERLGGYFVFANVDPDDAVRSLGGLEFELFHSLKHSVMAFAVEAVSTVIKYQEANLKEAETRFELKQVKS